MASAARWCFAAAICALLGTALLLSGGDLASTSVLLRGALHGGASEAAEGGAIGPAAEKPRRLEDSEVDMEEDFFKKPAKERLLSEEPPLRKLTQGSCQGCTSNEVTISEELMTCVAEKQGGCALKSFCEENAKDSCCVALCAEPTAVDWACDVQTTICGGSTPATSGGSEGNSQATSLSASLLSCIYQKGGPCQLQGFCKIEIFDKGASDTCCDVLEAESPPWQCSEDYLTLMGYKAEEEEPKK